MFSTISFPFLETTVSGDRLPFDTFKMKQMRFRESYGWKGGHTGETQQAELRFLL